MKRHSSSSTTQPTLGTFHFLIAAILIRDFSSSLTYSLTQPFLWLWGIAHCLAMYRITLEDSLSTVIWPAAAKSLQSCPTLCDPIDGSPPGSPVPGIPQERTLEWVAISFSNAWRWKVKVKSFSHVRLLATPWTAAYQAPLSMGFSRQEYWSGVPLPSPVIWPTNNKSHPQSLENLSRRR